MSLPWYYHYLSFFTVEAVKCKDLQHFVNCSYMSPCNFVMNWKLICVVNMLIWLFIISQSCAVHILNNN